MDFLFYIFIIFVYSAPFLLVPAKLIFGSIFIIYMFFRKSSHRTFDISSLRFLIIIFVGTLYVIYPFYTKEIIEGSFIYVFPLHVLFIIFWAVLLSFLSQADFRTIEKATLTAAWISWFYAIGLLIQGMGFLPFELPHIYGEINYDPNGIKLASSSISALLFVSPALTYFYLKNMNLRRLVLLLIFWVGIIFLGRRSALAGFVIPALLLLGESISSAKVFRRVLMFMPVVLASTFLLLAFDPYGVRSLLGQRLTVTADAEPERIEQAWGLIDGFLERPLIGHGLGTGISVVRADDRPWRYELSYIASLYRFGIIGCLLFCYAYLIPILQCLRGFRHLTPPERMLFSGVCGMLFAYAFNPVLDSFDTLWMLLLPIIFAARMDSRRRAERRQALEYSASPAAA